VGTGGGAEVDTRGGAEVGTGGIEFGYDDEAGTGDGAEVGTGGIVFGYGAEAGTGGSGADVGAGGIEVFSGSTSWSTLSGPAFNFATMAATFAIILASWLVGTGGMSISDTTP
jgi:hypothetical protein